MVPGHEVIRLAGDCRFEYRIVVMMPGNTAEGTGDGHDCRSPTQEKDRILAGHGRCCLTEVAFLQDLGNFGENVL